MFLCLTNHPNIPLKLPDMCETCEAVQTEDKVGHHTFLAYERGSRLTEGLCLWFCSRKCFEMSPVPTIDDGRWPD